jgi:ABC-type dipeptide/oligopeptide/nickel transport system permease component
MTAFLVRRFVMTMLMLFLVALAVFSLGHLSGDPVRLMVPDEATEQQMEKLRHELGLDRPLYVQFADFVTHALHGDIGISLRFRRPALSLVLNRMPATIELSTAAMAIALLVAIPAGIVSAMRPGSWADTAVSAVAITGQALPAFWIGIVLIILFAVQLGWLPASGRGGITNLILPAVTLGLWPMARISRLLRSSLREVAQQEFVRTARSKGLGERVILRRHTLRNACIPVVTIIAIIFGTMLGGTVITETVFAWPGIGRLALEAVFNRDFPLVQATVFVVAVIFVFINFFLDLVYVAIDPRIRLD